MTKPSLLSALEARVLLSDGAMGTQLQQAGLESGGCGEAWNVDHPERVLAIQRGYAEAGSDILLTNTFGACRIMLNRHGQGERTVEINRAAVAVAREALGGRGYVLGDIGPFGGLMEPYGEIAAGRRRARLPRAGPGAGGGRSRRHHHRDPDRVRGAGDRDRRREGGGSAASSSARWPSTRWPTRTTCAP